MSQSLAITWPISSVSGYGLYGLQIALHMLRSKAEKIVLTCKPGPVILSPLAGKALEPVLSEASQFSAKQSEPFKFDFPVLYAVGNEFLGFDGQDRIDGSLHVGCAAFEHKQMSAQARAYAKRYGKLIAISRWNEKFLKGLDIAPVHLCYQGVDTDIFTPGPGAGFMRDRFVIFSGGKFEFRKGHDIVLAAFKEFQRKHKEALLLTAWQNRAAADQAPYILAGHIQTTPTLGATGLNLDRWMAEQGLPTESFLNLPFTPNLFMPATLRECALAIFPNRCEGGTNLVAMEALACGVPTYVADNTGQKDLVELLGCNALTNQQPVKSSPHMASVEDWGESDVDEVIAAMEFVYQNREAEKAKAVMRAEKLKAFDWALVNDRLLDAIQT